MMHGILSRCGSTTLFGSVVITVNVREAGSAELRCYFRLAGKREKRSGKLGGRDGREEIGAPEGVHFIQPRHKMFHLIPVGAMKSINNLGCTSG
jgi:hypothetical protein